MGYGDNVIFLIDTETASSTSTSSICNGYGAAEATVVSVAAMYCVFASSSLPQAVVTKL